MGPPPATSSPQRAPERLATVHDITGVRALGGAAVLPGTPLPGSDPHNRLAADDISAIFRLVDAVHTQAAVRSVAIITRQEIDRAARIVDLLTGRSAEDPAVYFQLHASVIGTLMSPGASSAEFAAFHPLLRRLGEHNVAQYARLGVHPREGPFMHRVIESYHRLIAAFRDGDPAVLAGLMPAHHATVADNTLLLLNG